MENNALAIKAAITSIIGFLTIVWGLPGWLFVALLFTMSMDYITGWIRARNNGEWKSCVAKKGLGKKFAIIIISVTAYLIDWVVSGIIAGIPGITLPFTYSVLVGPIVTIWYLLAEFGSILENCAGLGAKEIPFLSRIINMLKKTIEKAGDKIAPEGKK